MAVWMGFIKVVSWVDLTCTITCLCSVCLLLLMSENINDVPTLKTNYNLDLCSSFIIAPEMILHYTIQTKVIKGVKYCKHTHTSTHIG